MACCVFVGKASFGLKHIFYPIAKPFKAVVLIILHLSSMSEQSPLILKMQCCSYIEIIEEDSQCLHSVPLKSACSKEEDFGFLGRVPSWYRKQNTGNE